MRVGLGFRGLGFRVCHGERLGFLGLRVSEFGSAELGISVFGHFGLFSGATCWGFMSANILKPEVGNPGAEAIPARANASRREKTGLV